MLKVLSILGTRPEAIKMAPVVLEVQRRPDMRGVVCNTAQHRELLQPVLDLFRLEPEHDLGVMQAQQTPSGVAAAVLERLEPVLARETPDWVLVQGDTTTVAAASLCAYYAGAKLGHVEAGLRTWDKSRPFPEEGNRRITDAIADLYFAPTQQARENLLREGVADAAIRVTGNTGIDALLAVAEREHDWSGGPLARIPRDRRLVLVTTHRRESFGAPLAAICRAVRELSERFADRVHFVCPVHLNRNVAEPMREVLAAAPGVTLTEPLDYLTLVQLLKRCALVLTDSGGIQEEAPTLGVPVLVMREKTERPEGVEAGVARLVGTDRQTIVAEAAGLLEDAEALARMSGPTTLYGDGRAAQRIADALAGG